MFALKQRPEATDKDLIAAVLDGSEAAFGDLVGRYQDRVFRLLSRYCRDSVECEDLAQDVFLKVFRKLHTFNHQSQFFTWLYRITVNAATDHLSRASSRRLRLVEDTEVFERGGNADSASDPTAPLESEELAAVTRKLVATLPEKFRTILVLREFEGLTYTEISEVLEIQLGTVESRLFRARQRFKEALIRQHPELLPTVGGGASHSRGAKSKAKKRGVQQ
ncbi:MAG: sigma-70 family RNA polymerase sigma factor [Planctomycetota bacterium]